MEFLQRLRNRASVRDYQRTPIPEEDVLAMLEAAQRAPTDATAQLYTILRIKDRALRSELARLAGGQKHIEDAAEFFVILADVHRLEKLLEFRGESMGRWPRTALHFAIVDAALAGANLATMAETLGYGICWIGGVLNRPLEVAELLDLPPGVLPVAGLTVGVPVERPKPRPRLPQSLVVHTDRYRDYSRESLESAYEAMAPISRNGDWLKILKHYFAKGGVMEARDAGYGQLVARQGFAPDFTSAAAAALKARGLSAASLGEAIEALLERGWRGALFQNEGEGQHVVWIEKEDQAHRGEGDSPGEALAAAIEAAYPDPH